ncbi:MAG TPA: type II secretion system F family protein [Tardiphaga sp.]
MNIQALALAFLAFTAVGGIAWVFVYPMLSGEKKAEHRRASVARSAPVVRQVDKAQRSRREQVEGSLKEVEARRLKEKNVALPIRIAQAGLDWTAQKFLVVSGILGAVAFGIPMLLALNPGLTSPGYLRETAIDGPAAPRALDLGYGKSIVIELPREIRNVQVDSPQVVKVLRRTEQSVFVTGVTTGNASIALFDDKGSQMVAYSVAVTRDLFSSLVAALGLGFAAGFGLPRWMLNFLKKRREKNFLKALPDAVDVIVRGIKAGLPLFDSIKVVAADAPEPLRSEFYAIIETQAIGMPLGEACARMYERMPVPEANFFGIVVAIQQKSGGNLSEALGNLSKVLRDRKKMAEKIQAMSMEAKASAAIIGSLPPIVMLLVYLSTPDYISLLWTHPTGRLMLAASAVWMSCGIFVMKKMINFDF